MKHYFIHTTPLEQFYLIATLIASILIILRLLTYQKIYARHKMFMSGVAWLLVVAYFALVVRIVTGVYLTPVDPSELAIHATLLLAVWMAKGNIARFLTTS